MTVVLSGQWCCRVGGVIRDSGVVMTVVLSGQWCCRVGGVIRTVVLS